MASKDWLAQLHYREGNLQKSGRGWGSLTQKLWDQIYQIMLRNPNVLCSMSDDNLFQ